MTLVLVALTPAACQDALYFVDVLKVVCDGQPFEVDLKHLPVSYTSDPVVPVFYRSSLKATNIVFSVATKGEAQVAVPETSVDLVATGRRLADFVVEPLRRLLLPSAVWSGPADAGAGAAGATAGGVDSVGSVDLPTCQEFFLMDGRQPVDLPETWSEARHAFGAVCEGEGIAPERCTEAGAALFMGQPEGEVPFNIDAAFCKNVAQYAADVWGDVRRLPRRLKGSGYYGERSSGSLGTRYTSSKASSYGYTTSTLGSRYSGGYSSASYGYWGRRPYLPVGGTVGPTGGVTPVSMIAAPTRTGYSSFYYYGYGSYYYGRSGSTGRIRKIADQNVNCDENSQCVYDLPDNVTMIRDDLMNFGFIPDSICGAACRTTNPMVLRIRYIGGEDWGNVTFCPPVGWTEANNMSYQPKDVPLLFFTLSQAETSTMWSEATATVIALSVIFGGVLPCCCMCCFCFYAFRRSKDQASKGCDAYTEHTDVVEGTIVGVPTEQAATSFAAGRVQVALHDHLLEESHDESTWGCDNCVYFSAVRDSPERKRYRCTMGCNWDLCGDCFDQYAPKQPVIEASILKQEDYPDQSFEAKRNSTKSKLKDTE